MANDSNPSPGPGRQNINQQLVAAASGVPSFLAMRAAGASRFGAVLGTAGGFITQSTLGPAAALAAIMTGILRTTVAIVRNMDLYNRGVQRAAGVERIESAFTTLLRSASRARQEVKALLDFANRTPFQYASILEAGRTLLVLTKGAYSGAAALKQVGDVAAATNTPVEETAFWLGKLFNFLQQGRSVAGLLFRLQDLGIVSGELANNLETLEAQGASFGQKWQAVQNELARANGAMQDENRSLAGLQARLDRTGEALEKAFGQDFLAQEKNSTYATIRLYETFLPLVRQIGFETSKVTGVFRGWTATLKGSLIEQLGVGKAAQSLYETLTLIAGGTLAAGLTRAFGAIGGTLTRAFSRGGAIRSVGRAQRAFAGGTLGGEAASLAQAGRSELAASRGHLSKALSDVLNFAILDAAISLGHAGASGARGYAGTVRARATAIAEESAARSASTGRLGRFLGRGTQIGVGAATSFVIARDALSSLYAIALRVAALFGRGLIAIGPIGAVAAVVGSLTVYFTRLLGQMNAANEANNRLARSISDASRAMNDQIRNVKTLADFHGALATAVDNLSKAQEQITNFKPSGIAAADRDTRQQLEAQLKLRQRELDLVRNRGRGPFLRPAEQERDEAANRRELDEAKFQAELEHSDEAGRARLLAGRAAKLQSEASQGRFLRTAEENDPAAQQIRDIEARRTLLQNEQAQAEKLQQDLQENPSGTREQIAGQLGTTPLNDAERARLAALKERRTALTRAQPLSISEQQVFNDLNQRQITAQKSPLAPQLRPEQVRQLEELRSRLGAQTTPAQQAELGRVDAEISTLEHRAEGSGRASAAQVEAEIQRRQSRAQAIPDELKKLDEERAQAERRSQAPTTRLTREAQDAFEKAQALPVGSAEQNRALEEAKRLQSAAADAQVLKERAPQLESQAVATQAQARDLQFRARITSEELAAQKEILALRGEGLAYEIKTHELTLDSLRRRAEATAKEFGANDTRTLEARNAVTEEERRGETLQRQRESFRADLQTQRNINTARASGDRRGARALEDQAAIRDQALQLVQTLGLSPEEAAKQASSDFFLKKRADLVDQAPRISADSLQAVGGGGGSFGPDIAKVLAERQLAQQQRQTQTLEQIRDLLAGGQGGPIDNAGY